MYLGKVVEHDATGIIFKLRLVAARAALDARSPREARWRAGVRLGVKKSGWNMLKAALADKTTRVENENLPIWGRRRPRGFPRFLWVLPLD
jgi:hypothetical protein